jgi:predicted ferric reductase
MLAFPPLPSNKARAFTFVSRNEDPELLFLIKQSPDSESITHHIISAQKGDTVAMAGVFGTHRATGPGTFIAAGIGIAPFLAIARSYPDITKQSTLLWSLKKAEDILYEEEVNQLFKQVIITLTQESNATYKKGRISQELLKKLPVRNVQICGSYEFNREMKKLIVLLTHQA